MVQTPITEPRMSESLLFRRLIRWMRLLIAGNRSEGVKCEGSTAIALILVETLMDAFFQGKRQKAFHEY